MREVTVVSVSDDVLRTVLESWLREG